LHNNPLVYVQAPLYRFQDTAIAHLDSITIGSIKY